jgi:hypothetical protein
MGTFSNTHVSISVITGVRNKEKVFHGNELTYFGIYLVNILMYSTLCVESLSCSDPAPPLVEVGMETQGSRTALLTTRHEVLFQLVISSLFQGPQFLPRLFCTRVMGILLIPSAD